VAVRVIKCFGAKNLRHLHENGKARFGNGCVQSLKIICRKPAAADILPVNVGYEMAQP
jgi:hypothetical protein